MLNEKIKEFDIPVVSSSIDSFDDFNDFIEYTKNLKNAEGFVISFEDGHKIKLKADEYVQIHNAKEKIQFDRNIIKMVLDNTIDDVYSHLDEMDMNRVDTLQQQFWDYFHEKEEYIKNLSSRVIEETGGDRKIIALEYVPNFEDKMLARYVFGTLDNRDVYDMLMSDVEKNLHSNVKWDSFWVWLKGDKS